MTNTTVSMSPKEHARHLRGRCAAAVATAMKELLVRIGNTADPAERTKLQQAHNELSATHLTLLGQHLKEVNDSPQVQAALAQLEATTDELVDEAATMKNAADAIAKAAKIAGMVAKAVSALAIFI